MSIELPPKDQLCHRTGFAQSCRLLVAEGKCGRWMTLEGEDPASGAPLIQSRCMDDWVPWLLVDNSRKIQNGTLGVQKAVERFRNHAVVGIDTEEHIPTPKELERLNSLGGGSPALAIEQGSK
jgi:hypothetical protein